MAPPLRSTPATPVRGAARVHPNLKEVVFQGAIDPHTPIGQGWLRASHRNLDEKLSTPWRPFLANPVYARDYPPARNLEP
jgi:hypothetical protein